MSDKWKPSISTEILDENIDNAFKRVSGTVGFSLRKDISSFNTTKDTVGRVMDVASHEPIFMRVFQGARDLSCANFKTQLSMKEIAAEILGEFYEEGTAAFKTTQARLYAEALKYLKDQGLTDELAKPILHAANDSFTEPPKEKLMAETDTMSGKEVAPLNKAIMTAVITMACLVVVVRVPHIAAAGAIGAGAATYYFAFQSRTRKSYHLLQNLPMVLYNLLKTSLNTNIDRFTEIINTTAENIKR